MLLPSEPQNHLIDAAKRKAASSNCSGPRGLVGGAPQLNDHSAAGFSSDQGAGSSKNVKFEGVSGAEPPS